MSEKEQHSKEWRVEPWYVSGIHSGYRVCRGVSFLEFESLFVFVGDTHEPGSFDFAKDNAEAFLEFVNSHTEDEVNTLIRTLSFSPRLCVGCLDYIPTTQLHGHDFKIRLWSLELYPTGKIEAADRSVGIMNEYFNLDNLTTIDRRFVSNVEFRDEAFELLSDFINELYHIWKHKVPVPEGF